MEIKKYLTSVVIFVIIILYLSYSYQEALIKKEVLSNNHTYMGLIELTNKMNRTVSIQAIIIIAVFNIAYMVQVYATKKTDTKIGDTVLFAYFVVIGSVISFIIYNLNFCFKPWLIPFKSTIAKIITRPDKNEIGKILGEILSPNGDDESAHEKQTIESDPFPLFFSAQSNHLIDFLKYLNHDYDITPQTELSNSVLNHTKFEKLYNTLVAIEKNAVLVWVILFATFFSQTTITYMKYVG